MSKHLPRQDPPRDVPEPLLVDGLRVDGRDPMEARRRLIRQHNAARQRATTRQRVPAAVAVVQVDGARMWVWGGHA